MKVVVIGASGTIGKAIVAALGGHDVIEVSRSSGQYRADIEDKASLEKLFAELGEVDAIISAAGGGAWKPLVELTDADFAKSLSYKLMGQVNVLRTGLASLRKGGSITLTTGVLASEPTPGSAAISLINSGVEGFARAAALELKDTARVNVVSPPWVSETLVAMGQDGSGGMPAAAVAKVYADIVLGHDTGKIVDARKA